jgi:hypothetical protein
MTASGQKYVDLAYQGAAPLTQHIPHLKIHLFTEADRNCGPFSRVHVLQGLWFLSKLDTILQNRFGRTLCLDANLLMLTYLRDFVEVLKSSIWPPPTISIVTLLSPTGYSGN